MTTPMPPGEAHPTSSGGDGSHGAEPPRPRSDEGVVEAAEHDDFDDTDTGPVHVVQPAAEAAPAGRWESEPREHWDPEPRGHWDSEQRGRWESEPQGRWDAERTPVPPRSPGAHGPYGDRFAAPMTVDPRAFATRRARRNRPVLVGAAVAVVVLALVAGWLLWPSGGGPDDDPKAARDSAAVERLRALLPSGYASDSCTPVEAPGGAEAKVTCGRNSDVDGPPTASYTLLKDGDALKAAMDDVIANAGIVNCPNNILSPGPWRRNATPTLVAGNLVCGLPQGKPMIAWTNDAELLLSMVRVGPDGPTLDQLYQWWSNHS